MNEQEREINEEYVSKLERMYFDSFGMIPDGSPAGGRFSEEYVNALIKAIQSGNPRIEIIDSEEAAWNAYREQVKQNVGEA